MTALPAALGIQRPWLVHPVHQLPASAKLGHEDAGGIQYQIFAHTGAGGDGLLTGTWIPLSMIGYAIGAKFALEF